MRQTSIWLHTVHNIHVEKFCEYISQSDVSPCCFLSYAGTNLWRKSEQETNLAERKKKTNNKPSENRMFSNHQKTECSVFLWVCALLTLGCALLQGPKGQEWTAGRVVQFVMLVQKSHCHQMLLLTSICNLKRNRNCSEGMNGTTCSTPILVFLETIKKIINLLTQHLYMVVWLKRLLKIVQTLWNNVIWYCLKCTPFAKGHL